MDHGVTKSQAGLSGHTQQLYTSPKNRYFQLQINHTTARALALTNILSASLRTNVGLVTG